MKAVTANDNTDEVISASQVMPTTDDQDCQAQPQGVVNSHAQQTSMRHQHGAGAHLATV
jgi:hypothetical protein